MTNINVLDKQLAKQNDVRFCTSCVISNQRPRITFDDRGICSACKYAELKNNVIDWEKRESELIDLLNKHRSSDGSYDCLVPGSGGKDSSFVAHQLKHDYGMHPLTITWAPFIHTDIGWSNYIAFKDSGFDNLLFFPGGQIHRKLSQLGFELVGDNFLPFIYGQKAFAMHIAIKHKIPLIFFGENPEAEYGGSLKYVDKSHEDAKDYENLYFKGVSLDELIENGLSRGVLSEADVNSNSFEFYRLPPSNQITASNLEMHWYSYYRKWIPQENYYYASEFTGFRSNPGRSEGTYSKYASLDDRTDGFHYYMGFIKFGIGRATSDAAHEIRDGHITRDEGISLVNRFDGEFPKKYFYDFLKYINITENRFWEVVNYYRARSSHIWKNVDGDWKLRHTVSLDGTDD